MTLTNKPRSKNQCEFKLGDLKPFLPSHLVIQLIVFFSYTLKKEHISCTVISNGFHIDFVKYVAIYLCMCVQNNFSRIFHKACTNAVLFILFPEQVN